MALKPLPKLIIIAAIASGVGYALMHTNITSMLAKKPEVAPVIETPVTVPSQSTAQATPTVQATQPTAMQEASETPPPRPTTADNGLAAVLGAGKK